MLDVFIDTIIVCSMTGFVILVTGTWTAGSSAASMMTSMAFEQALPGVVTQPAPQVRCQTAHQHGNGDQLADPRRRKAQVVEVQRQERRRTPEQSEVEEVEAGQPPVRQGRTRPGHSCGSTGVVTRTSAFCAR